MARFFFYCRNLFNELCILYVEMTYNEIKKTNNEGEYKMMVNMVTNIQIKEAASKLRDYNYECVGIRVEQGTNVKVGETMTHLSSRWDDNIELEEKHEGVCAIDVSGINCLKNISYNGYLGDTILILGCQKRLYGEEDAEIIMINPIVLEIIKAE